MLGRVARPVWSNGRRARGHATYPFGFRPSQGRSSDKTPLVLRPRAYDIFENSVLSLRARYRIMFVVGRASSFSKKHAIKYARFRFNYGSVPRWNVCYPVVRSELSPNVNPHISRSFHSRATPNRISICLKHERIPSTYALEMIV